MNHSSIAVTDLPVREAVKPIKEDTRHRLLRAGLKLFSKSGYESTTVKELADEAGVNVSLVSYHFGGKENLYRACLQQFGQERLAATQRLLQPPHSLEELRVRLRMFIEEFANTHIENAQTCQLIHRECEKPDSIAEDVFKETFLKLFQTLVAFFEKSRETGFIRKDMEAPFLARVFWGSVLYQLKMDEMNERFFGETIKNPVFREKNDRSSANVFYERLHFDLKSLKRANENSPRRKNEISLSCVCGAQLRACGRAHARQFFKRSES